MEVIHGFEEATGLKINYAIKPRREGDTTAVFADCTKSNDVLGWKATKGLVESLADAWRWQEKISR
jgi:UDP-glucose 4-epimerase